MGKINSTFNFGFANSTLNNKKLNRNCTSTLAPTVRSTSPLNSSSRCYGSHPHHSLYCVGRRWQPSDGFSTLFPVAAWFYRAAANYSSELYTAYSARTGQAGGWRVFCAREDISPKGAFSSWNLCLGRSSECFLCPSVWRTLMMDRWFVSLWPLRLSWRGVAPFLRVYVCLQMFFYCC